MPGSVRRETLVGGSGVGVTFLSSSLNGASLLFGPKHGFVVPVAHKLRHALLHARFWRHQAVGQGLEKSQALSNQPDRSSANRDTTGLILLTLLHDGIEEAADDRNSHRCVSLLTGGAQRCMLGLRLRGGKERVVIKNQTTTDERRHARVSRAQLLTAAGASLAAALVPTAGATAPIAGSGRLEFPYFPRVPGSYTTEQIQDILNAVVTTRYLVADAVYFIITRGLASGSALTSQQIGLARFQYEIDFLASIGALPVTTTATLGLSDLKLLPKIQLATSVVTMSMFITAIREFAELGQPALAKWMAQLAAREAESVRGARDAAGNPSLPNAFESDLFLYTRDGLDALKGLGLWGGTGTPVPYPGRAAILAAAGPWADRIIQRKPNDASSSIRVVGLGDLDTILAERA